MISFTPIFNTTSDGYDPPIVNYTNQVGEIHLLAEAGAPNIATMAKLHAYVRGNITDFNGIEGAFCISGIPTLYMPKDDTGAVVRFHSATINYPNNRTYLAGRIRGGGTTVRFDASGPGLSTSRIDWTDSQGNPLHISLGDTWVAVDGIYRLKTPISLA